MSQITGAFSVELDLDRLAERVADKVLARLHQAAQEATAGSADPGEPDGWPAGGRHTNGGSWDYTRGAEG